ncbi:MAG TPA: tetratricopeptide repeat protein [Vicinamibacterales bacterium]|nr:tetratricopeptide repeat protein [Vicinamibacterales bacterium]
MAILIDAVTVVVTIPSLNEHYPGRSRRIHATRAEWHLSFRRCDRGHLVHGAGRRMALRAVADAARLRRSIDNPIVAARLAGRWTVAERAFRRVTDLWPEEMGGWLELTWALGTLDRTAEAVVAAQRAVDLSPDSPATLGNLASALVQNGRAKEALPLIRRAIELDPSNWKNQQIRNHVEAAAAEPTVAPETEPDASWYKRWFR